MYLKKKQNVVTVASEAQEDNMNLIDICDDRVDYGFEKNCTKYEIDTDKNELHITTLCISKKYGNSTTEDVRYIGEDMSSKLMAMNDRYERLKFIYDNHDKIYE